MMLIWPAKDPDEALDYSWAPALDDGDTIDTFTPTVTEGDVVIDSSPKTDTAGTVWLSGGTVDSQLRLVAVTTGGRTFEETVAVPIRASGSDLAATLKAVFPDFAEVGQSAIDYWAARAERSIDETYGDDQAHATLLLTAHYLVMQGLGSGVEAQRVAEFAGATRIKSGSIELGWSDSAKSTGSRYGDELLRLIRALKGGPRVTGTGVLPCGGGYNGFAGPLPPYGC